ncbi:MAG: hypothetical protein HOV81_41095 [Kofleriaceae bacterium]|nr:hypothetical protein [Kofleriaceae bacterium]
MKVGVLWMLLLFVVASCTKPNPAVCCVSEDDCNAIGLDAVRECGDGLVCIKNECELPTTCLQDADCAEPTPFCDPGHGCVECLQSGQCPADRPVCDLSSNLCTTCSADDECASSVCDSTAGTCLPESDVLYVSTGGPEAGLCERSNPCALIHAVAVSGPGRNTVKLASGAYTATVSVIDKPLVIHGVGATVTAPTSSYAFRVENAGRLRLEGLTVVSLVSNQSPIRCENATTATPRLELYSMKTDAMGAGVLGLVCDMTIERSVIVGRNQGFLLYLVSSTAVVDRSAFQGTSQSGSSLSASSSMVQITNSTLTGLRGVNDGFEGGPFDISFSTLVDSTLTCGSPGTTTSSKFDSLVFYNSRSDAPSSTITGTCDIHYSVVFPQFGQVGPTNVTGLQPHLRDVAAGDYHLESSSPAVDRGNPASTLSIDFEGTPRPQGGVRDSGAFEFRP